MIQFIMVFILLVLMENTVKAQVFKCVGLKGNVVYQDKACSTATRQSVVEFDQLNPDIILKAQKELSDKLNRREERKALLAQQLLKEREIIAIEEQARSNEALSRAARENTSAIEKNTEKARFRRHPNRFFYNRPKHRQKISRAKSGRHTEQKSRLNLKISIK